MIYFRAHEATGLSLSFILNTSPYLLYYSSIYQLCFNLSNVYFRDTKYYKKKKEKDFTMYIEIMDISPR